MTEEIHDPLLTEANRRAHRVAREALKFHRDLRECVDVGLPADFSPVVRALEAYEEIERRAEKEATL